MTPAVNRAAAAVIGGLLPAAAPAQEHSPDPPAEAQAAQEGAPVPGTEAGQQRWSVTLGGDARLQFRTGLDRPSGDVQISHSGFDVVFAAQAAERLRVSVDLGFEWSNYDFDDAAGLIPGESDPFNDLYALNLKGYGVYAFDDRWSMTVGGFGEAAGEIEADFADGVTGGFFGGVGYAFSKDLFLTLGAGFWTRLEDDPVVLPFVTLLWRIDERLRLEVNGVRGSLTWTVNEQVELALRGGAEYRQFRLDDSRAAFESGVVRDFSVPLGLEVAWRPTARLRLSVEGGAIVYQQMKFVDDGGEEIREFNTDPAPYVGVRVEYIF